MQHGDVSFGKVVVRRLMKQEDQRKKQGTIPDRSKRFLGTLAYGCLEGRRREGVTWVQQRCQWSEAKAELTSVLRLHDATNAYLSMKHDVAKQAANEMAFQERGNAFHDLHAPLAVGPFQTKNVKLTFWLDQAYGLETSVHHAFL